MAEEKDIAQQTGQGRRDATLRKEVHATWRRLTSIVCAIILCAIIVVTAWLINHVREDAAMLRGSYYVTVVLRDSVDDAYGDSLTAALSAHPFVAKAEYHNITNREAVMRDSLGEDSMQLTAANPLRPYITLLLTTHPMAERLPKLTAQLRAHTEVDDVLTAPDMLKMEEQYLPKAVIAVYVLGAIILLLCSILFIHSLIRIARNGKSADDAHDKADDKADEAAEAEEPPLPEDA